ncbi:MAG: hypothetical protein ABIS10_10550 [Novosphingobium sp.]
MPSVELESVQTEGFTSSEGEDALRITLVLTPETVEAITGDDALKLLLEINDSLRREGDERFAIVEYTTADDVPVDED